MRKYSFEYCLKSKFQLRRKKVYTRVVVAKEQDSDDEQIDKE